MKQHIYNEDEKAFFREFVPGHSHREIQVAFAKKFNWAITLTQVKCAIARYKLNTGRTGRFEKGHIPVNQGKKGVCAKGSEKSWFKKGHIPKNHRPVGSERINVDGYIEIKVAEPSTWKLKHRVLWEQEKGPLKKGDIVTFLDGNKQNITIGNLMKISQRENAIINKLKRTGDASINKAIIATAKLELMINDKKRP